MMPRTGAGVFGGGKPVLDIRPDSPFVVFYGDASESESADLTGKLVLNTPESMSVRGIRLTLTGMRRISWSNTKAVTPQPIMNKCRFLHETLNFFPSEGTKNKAHKISGGSHEWDFRFTLPGDTDESVEGLGTNWIVYDLHATVDRGYISKQLTATSHIRIIRTLSRDPTESMPDEQINEDIWASKLAYKITVPHKNYIVGTSITADFVLIPLRKGVEISTIKMELIETRQLFCDYAGRRISHQYDMTVAQKEGLMPENSACLVPSGVEDADQLFDESHRFTMTLNLPKSLKDCRQSVDTEHLRIQHRLRIYVNLKNPEGHTSQLLVKNFLHLFISPNLPPNPDQSVVVDQNIIDSVAMRDALAHNAPPTYGLHQLDELYNDIDPSGFITPGGPLSGVNTPVFGHSRSGSTDDLAMLNTIAEQSGGGASASALHNRLYNLSMDQSPRAARYAPARHPSSGGSTPHTPAEELIPPPPSGYFPDPSSLTYDMAALARTPSYNTAVRTPARTPPASEELPTYEIATSRPSSPSPARSRRSSSAQSLDTLTEETQRNTVINSGRQSPRRDPWTSDEGR